MRTTGRAPRRTKTPEHELRVLLLNMVHDCGELRALLESQSIPKPDHDFYSRMVDRAQHAIHSIQERLDEHPPRPDGH